MESVQLKQILQSMNLKMKDKMNLKMKDKISLKSAPQHIQLTKSDSPFNHATEIGRLFKNNELSQSSLIDLDVLFIQSMRYE